MTDEEEKLIATRTDSRGMVRSMRVVDADQKPAAPPIVIPEQPVAPLVPHKTSTVHVEGTFSDRARGFNIVTWNLSLVIGGVFVVVAAVLRNNEIGLMAMALVFFFGFSITWAIAYAGHTFISPEGSQLYEIFRMWNYLDSEQRARHRYYGVAGGKGWKYKVINSIIIVIGMLGLFGLALNIIDFIKDLFLAAGG